ncbi:hypothetical protein M501DRAFT_925368 [Patellaria atrata CBS 101060]|uniref:Uncharacterized protein n=1 Tax=Patellaria atrata CBS 101060 TaxID=1346257 RepID=A0A9P4SJD2_9PEZI|nr:hypothetical protein M501DRAFT_925368 [Patellaria atrata CBS 101060]
MSYTAETASSRGRQREKASSQRSRTPLISAPSSLKTGRESAAKIADADFLENVLHPHGVTIENLGVNKDLRKHFSIQDKPSDLKERLNVYKQALALTAWVELDAAQVQQGYQAMRIFECNEAEHSAYALKDIFRDEPKHPWLPEEAGDQCLLPIRLLQLIRIPPQEQWEAPPLITPPKKRYDWDIRPDCAYHVSLQAFQSGFRPSVRNHVSVVQKRAFSPYLTIEFKKDEKTLEHARHQVAVHSAIALYNRYRLKSCALHCALQMAGRPWSEDDKAHMRHYGITFTGSIWNLWYIAPNTFETWTGCSMSCIYSGDCAILSGVQQLAAVINDVHFWGMMVHGQSCKADITAKIRSDPDADTGDITLLE